MGYSNLFNPNQTPQTEKAEENQVKNSAGGYVFQIDQWKQLERFLILGSDGGTYYATPQKLTRENAKVVQACFAEDPSKTVIKILEISESGRAPKNDAAIFALALCMADPKWGERGTNKQGPNPAFEAIRAVCRTGTHLFQLVELLNEWRGWGSGLTKAVGNWYTQRPVKELEYQVTKYRQRHKFTHRDVLRLTHPEADTPEHQTVLRWITHGKEGLGELMVAPLVVKSGCAIESGCSRTYPAVGPLSDYLAAFEELQACTEPKKACVLIHAHRFGFEHVPSELLQSSEVWEALAAHMPLGATLRNLGNLTAKGVLMPLGNNLQMVLGALQNEEAIKKARIHPIAVLLASGVYGQGHGDKGKLKWTPIPQLVEALGRAFHLAFQTIVPTGQRIMIGLDVSGSMYGNPVPGCPGVDAATAAAAVAMTIARSERQWHCLGFSHVLVPVGITPSMNLQQVIQTMRQILMGGTDSSLPMKWAMQNGVEVDAFVTITDNETWAGTMHTHQQLRAYRDKTGIAAKSAVMAVTSTGFSIADPADPLQMDFVGFDSHAPSLLADFIRG